MADQRPRCSTEKFGKYACTRCGWKWTPRAGRPDLPRACARCRAAYWQSAPVSSRANSPEDPKWLAERDLVSRRRRQRHLAKLKELVTEFGLEPPPIEGERVIFPANDTPRATAPLMDLRDRFNDRPRTRLATASASPAGVRFSKGLAGLMAESDAKTETPSRAPVRGAMPDQHGFPKRRTVEAGGVETSQQIGDGAEIIPVRWPNGWDLLALV